jgi:hypothetical protein
MSRRELLGLGLAWGITCGPPATADESSAALADRYPELHQAYYDLAVCQYCGLVSAEVFDGYRREVADLVVRDSLDEARDRAVRLHAWTAADLEYGNRGLGGFRNWCRTEGASAVQRFLAYRAQALSDRAGPE